MNKVKAVGSRKRVVGAGLLVALMAVVAVWSFNTRTTSAQSTGGFEGAIMNVTPVTGQTFSITAVAAGATFTNQGTITMGQSSTGIGTGTFYRTGVKLPSGAAVVQDVYVLTSFGGAIMAEGVVNPDLNGVIEGANLSAVTGGVGTFRGAQGEAQITTNADGTLRVVLVEVPRRIGDDRVR